MWVPEYSSEGIHKTVFNLKIKCGYWHILVFWCFFKIKKKQIIFMYLKLLDSIIAEEFQNDRRVYIMQSEKKPHNGELVIDLAFLWGVRSIKVGYQKAWESVLE